MGGRSAKLVRTAAFEKRKRSDQGKDWKKSQWKEARDREKQEKRADLEAPPPEVTPGSDGSAKALAKPKKDLTVSFSGDVDMNAGAEPPREKFTPKFTRS